MSTANHGEFTYRWWLVAASVLAVVIFLFAASLNADAAPTSPGIPVTVQGTKLLVRAFIEDVVVPLHSPKEGFHFVLVLVEIKQGAPLKEVEKWKVTLRDAQGRIYESFSYYLGSGMTFTGRGETITIRGEGIGWWFGVPKGARRLWLVFPGGVSVDLAPLMRGK